MNTGFPEYTDSYLSGQDILYTQFNDIEFYVEDCEQEHFYFNVLKKLFIDLKFDKIFPLNGKKNVRDAAVLNIGNKKKVFIVDLDFDHILNNLENLDNLFYLKKYSIENYLCSKNAVYETIRAKDPKLKDHEIDNLFDFNDILKEASHCLKKLACCFIIIQNKELGLHYYGININRDFDFTVTPPCTRLNFINDYMTEVENKLKTKDGRYSLASQIKKFMKHFKNYIDCLNNIPGKYLLTYIKERLQILGLINQITLETFTYNLSKDFDSNELLHLKTEISKYIN